MKMRSLLKRFAVVIAFLLVTFPAFAKSWSINDYSDNILIEKDGTAMVTEHLTCTFVGDYHGIFRLIPIQYPGPSHTNFTLYLKVLKVTDENGSPLKYEISTENEYRKIKIYIPGASDAQKQVLITYQVRNGIRHFDNFDEFYWNVTGGDWPVPVEHATAYVTFPTAAAAAGEGLRAQAFTGAYGSKESEATAKIDGARAEFETTNPLPLRGDFTIDVYIPKGILAEPSALARLGWFLGSNPILLLPPFAFVVMFLLWNWKGRDPDPGRSVAPMYEPPPNMTPAEAGALVGDEVHPRDITSTIVDLAVRGYIKIEETSEKYLFLNSKDYLFHLLKPRTEWSDLAAHERVLLGNMFQSGELCQLSSLKNHFYTAVPVIRSGIMAELKEKGMYGLDPDSAHGYGLLGALAVAAPFMILQWMGAVDFSLSGWLLWVCVVVAATIVYLFFRIMPAKSLSGAQTTVNIRGFQEFMNRVDGSSLRTMPSNTFEKFLPYAIALGVEEHWAKAFSGIMQTQPNWYVGGNQAMFNPMLFTHSVRSMADTAGQTFVAAPRSSSGGSGFGGGGVSGGGFSGGGSGRWGGRVV